MTKLYFPNSGVEAIPGAGISKSDEEAAKEPQGPVFHPPLAAHVMLKVVCQMGARGLVVEDAGVDVVSGAGLTSRVLSI